MSVVSASEPGEESLGVNKSLGISGLRLVYPERRRPLIVQANLPQNSRWIIGIEMDPCRPGRCEQRTQTL